MTDCTAFQIEKLATFNYEKFNDNAILSDIRNLMTLTYEYSEIAKNPECELRREYTDHWDIALVFVGMPDRFKHSQAAVKGVLLYATERIARTSNENFLREAIKSVFAWADNVEDEYDIDEALRKYVRLATMIIWCPGFFRLKIILSQIFKCFQIGEPKKRWVILSGTYDSGKTTIAGD